MNLIIVESPTKARTLSRFLGNGFTVEATTGHVKDLPKGRLGVDVKNKFEPEYILIKGKDDILEKIYGSSKKSSKIYLATDPDREGEAISQHVFEYLRDKKTSKDKFIRIVFHEITSEAVEEALKAPRKIDGNLVSAQIARRVLDRLVGYKLSPLLWRKVRRGLSAGRVQSVAVRLIVEKEREIEKFVPEEYWEIPVTLATKKKERFVTNPYEKDGKNLSLKSKIEADKIVKDLKEAGYKVFDVAKREVIKRPYPPFTTSTMTQSAARNLYFTAKKTMSVAQRLYEEGLITYHRTDSTNISKIAVGKVREYIAKALGAPYLPDGERFYKTQSRVAQEAHEAIRPTSIGRSFDNQDLLSMGKDAVSLYRLIWNRFVACQMSDSKYDETTVHVISSNGYKLKTVGRIMKFDGWRKILKGKDTEDSPILPELTKDEVLDFVRIDPLQKFTQPPARFNEASLIKSLEALGIGRPSTYAPIISTVQERLYVEKQEGKFFPTPIGIAVNDFLMKNFPDIFDYGFTADMEGDLDKIANGEAVWEKVMGSFWRPFDKKLSSVSENAKRVKIAVETTGEKCPKCEKGEQVIRIGRFGKFLSCSRFPDCDWSGVYLEKVGMKCPGCKKGEVIVKRTRRGKRFYGCSRYPSCKWASWRKPGEEKGVYGKGDGSGKAGS